jgi:hypothetical protein
VAKIRRENMANDNIRRYRLLVLRAALAMEIHGLRRRGKSAAQIVREEFGIKKRRRVDVYFAFCRKVKLDPSARICIEHAVATLLPLASGNPDCLKALGELRALAGDGD